MDRIREQRSNSMTSSNTTEVCQIIVGNQPISKDKGTLKMTSPNVVARLMGLTELPSPGVINRPQNTLAGNTRQKASPRSQRDDHLCEARSYQKSYVDQPQFKDVYEDTTKKSGSRMNSAAELLQQSDYLFPEHLRSRRSPSSYKYNQIAVLKPSNPQKRKARAKGRKAERECPVKDDIGSKQVHEDDFPRHTFSIHGSQSSLKSSIIPADSNGESNILPKRIVILKPDYVKAQNALNSYSSPDSSNFSFSDYSHHEQYANALKSKYYSRNIKIRKEVDFSKPRSRKATKPVKKATREMRDTSNCMMNGRYVANEFNEKIGEDHGDTMDSIPPSVKGSTDIRGLYDFSGHVSASESEGMKLTSYDLGESSVTSEAKKRLLQRLKKARKYKDVGACIEGNILSNMYQDVRLDDKKITLGEMLSTPDANLRNLGVKLGDISRGGYKDSHSKLLSSSRSVRTLSGGTSEKHNADGEYRVDDKLLTPKEGTYRYQRRVPKINSKKKENISIKNTRSSKRISQSDHLRCAYNSDILLESCSSQNQMEINPNKKVSKDVQLVISQTPNSVASIVDAVNIQHRSRTQSPESSDELPPELSIGVEKYDYSFVGDQEDSTPQRTEAEAESAESSKEAGNPSPVSVLEVSLKEDDVLSCTGSFEQVSADLRELQKQLQLLKRESKLYAGEATLNDCEVQQGRITSFESVGMHTHECWESSYIIDVLTESGFHDTDTDTFTSTCYFPDCPLGPWVFENLENKLHSEVAGLKHERRLLFDRINSALSEIPKSFKEPFPWVRPSSVGIGFRWQKCDISAKLHELLESQEKDAYEDVLERLLDKEMNWVGTRDFVDAIGIEIEKLVTEELLTELVNEVKFFS